MSDIKLTCDETPLAWPASISIDDLKVCKTCGIQVHAPSPGSLQVLTRRQSQGVGDGVNIDESISVGADYRGQRYSLDEAVFHTPGLHMFPGRKELYPAEYHIHFRTLSAPIRYITLVIPVSHMPAGAADMLLSHEDTKEYFAAIKAKPDPAAKRPTLETLLKSGNGKGIRMIQYQGPDIRGRTGDKGSEAPDELCNSPEERQFLLVLNVAQIRATDLERIPREGSLSTDPRDLPAPGITPKRAVPRDNLIRSAVLADPGILDAKKKAQKAVEEPTNEMECKPVKVVDGRDVIDVSGKAVDIKKLLGLTEDTETDASGNAFKAIERYAKHATMFVGVIIGLLFADFVIGQLWQIFFLPSTRLEQWEPLKVWIFFSIALTTAGFSDGIMGLLGL